MGLGGKAADADAALGEVQAGAAGGEQGVGNGQQNLAVQADFNLRTARVHFKVHDFVFVVDEVTSG